MAKELRGDDGTTEKLKKAKDSEERQVDQVCWAWWDCFYSLLWPWLLTPAGDTRNLLARAGADELWGSLKIS